MFSNLFSAGNEWLAVLIFAVPLVIVALTAAYMHARVRRELRLSRLANLHPARRFDLEDTMTVMNRFMRHKWTPNSGIAAVGIEQNAEGSYYLLVSVTEKSQKDRIPTEYEGVPVLAIVSSPSYS